uniref:Uncharacterized protein n=1 Tax=Schistosoma mansoni TaxID=6183 RepID=A0AA82MWB9_SCHMA
MKLRLARVIIDNIYNFELKRVIT